MPHDKHGHALAVGDIVLIPCTVKSVQSSTDYCNVELETTEPNFPGTSKGTLNMNSKQCLKAKKGKGGVPTPFGETLGPGKTDDDGPDGDGDADDSSGAG